MKSVLLWMSQNATLRDKVPRYRFVKRAVRKFMPGEDLASALAAAEEQRALGIATTFTRLGENVTKEAEALFVRDHYLDVLDASKARSLDAHVSTKLTQLGLDISPDLAFENMKAITQKAARQGTFTWIDMEQTSYVDVTLDVYRKIRAECGNIGVCLQSYLRRTPADLKGLYPLSPAIRMVKGAYKEPASLAYPRKSDVDEAFFSLCYDYLKNVDPTRFNYGFGTHDTVLNRRIIEELKRMGLDKRSVEFQMLYGIQTEEQRRLARDGYRVRVLIAYGEYWYPWYMRRLAERPANVWFVMKNLFS